MDINHNDNLIYKISNLELTDESLKNVDLSFHLVRMQKEADSFYQSSGIQLAPDVIKCVITSYSIHYTKLYDGTFFDQH